MITVDDVEAGAVVVRPRRSCNRHIDCDAADARQREKREARIAEVRAIQAEDAGKSWADTRYPLPAWRYVDDIPLWVEHCDDEDCEDCFGR